MKTDNPNLIAMAERARVVQEAFVETSNWKRSDNQIRELRKKVTFFIFAECDDLEEDKRGQIYI